MKREILKRYFEHHQIQMIVSSWRFVPVRLSALQSSCPQLQQSLSQADGSAFFIANTVCSRNNISCMLGNWFILRPFRTPSHVASCAPAVPSRHISSTIPTSYCTIANLLQSISYLASLKSVMDAEMHLANSALKMFIVTWDEDATCFMQQISIVSTSLPIFACCLFTVCVEAEDSLE